MAEVWLANVRKGYGEALAVDDLSLTIADGEFVALVGPSGCGKTTTLNMIAGLLELDGGEISIDGRRVNDLDPKDRDIAMVFQNYALYPNKSVRKNLAFPLQMRGMARGEIARRVDEAARMLDIGHLLERRPRELSGGQQQRVALGRDLVREPKVFLMDEPLSNLDAKLRVQMRSELKRFHQDLKATIVYVTHDQLEAMTMADRMAVMHGGKLQQYDTPERVYAHPANAFVASFVGSPAMNLIPARLTETGIAGDGWQLALPPALLARARQAGSAGVLLGVRHGAIGLLPAATPGAVEARVLTVEPTGDITFLNLRLGESALVASAAPDRHFTPGQPLWLEFDMARLHLFDAASELAL